MRYTFPGTADAIAFEDTTANMRLPRPRPGSATNYRSVYRTGRNVSVETMGRDDFNEIDEVAERHGGTEYVGYPAEDALT